MINNQHGGIYMSKVLSKYKNGNYDVMLFENGTKIRITNDDEFKPEFPESIDVNISNKCDGGCNFCYLNANPAGEHGDILNAKWVDSLHSGTELALNGNDMSHPDLIPFLEKLKGMGVIANLTVNQKHFEKHFNTLKDLSDRGLVHGLGISLVDPTDDFIWSVKQIPNTVIHTINGILTKEQVEKLSDNDLKILILGYKRLERGINYLSVYGDRVAENQAWLHDNLKDMVNHFNVVSFDNLALEQLNVRRLLDDEEWEQFFMGEDAQFTYYIDAVDGTFSRSSLTSREDRYPIGDKTVDEMFKIVRSKGV